MLKLRDIRVNTLVKSRENGETSRFRPRDNIAIMCLNYFYGYYCALIPAS